MAKNEIERLRKLREEYDRAREALLRGIDEELEERDGRDLSLIGRSVDWSREYIGKLNKARLERKRK
ncbi:hypothetical protein [Nocardiopsis synnemataformans]|uniref:hypothetical protein n=1 Tax=Nocardiopsis synnemataformans TaxID=61305 RepID=UPI003EB95B6C